MRLALINLTSGGLSGGYLKYLRRLVPLLARDERVERLRVYVPPSAHVEAPEVELHSWPAGRGWRGLRAELDGFGPDVVFIPTARWLDTGRPTVVMVRNMEPLLRAGWRNPLAEELRNVVRAREARRACERASRVIAVSAHVRDFLQRAWHIDPQRVGLVYHGVDEVERPLRPASLAGLGEGPFVFTAGSIRPARGLEDLLEALPAVGPLRDWPLVIAGGVDPRMGPCAERLKSLARRNGLEGRLVWAGKLRPAEMAWCYGRCGLFVMTSRAEACPNTALEALGAGCLAVSTDQPPMPEFFADAALYYRRRDPSHLAERLTEAASMAPDRAAAHRHAARARAGEFRWADTARRTVDELIRAARP